MLRAPLHLTLGLILFGLFFSAGSSLCRADEPADGPQVAPEAKKVLDAFGKYYAGLKGFSVDIDAQIEVVQQGRANTAAFEQKLRAERPNKLSYTLESAGGSGTLVSDGKEATVFIKSFGKYLTEPAPDNWEGLFKNPLAVGVISSGNAAVMTLSLLADDPAAGLVATVEGLEYGGIVEFDDNKCHLLKATSKEMDWQLWIDAGEKPLVRQFVPDLAKVFAKMTKQNRGNAAALANLKVTNIVKYQDWKIDPTFPADTFAFTAPEGVEQAESVADVLGGAGGDTGPHPLLGKVAPPVKLALLGGGSLDLAALKDKNVVILDFWATWCGPCQQAMPIIEKVAKAYKDKGVLLYAVNIQEAPEDVRAFMDNSDLSLKVALDTQGTVAQAYQASSIPQTVIVGKDGTVQVVHVGLTPTLEHDLSKELDALVAGKNLAADELAKSEKRKKSAAAAAKPDDEK